RTGSIFRRYLRVFQRAPPVPTVTLRHVVAAGGGPPLGGPRLPGCAARRPRPPTAGVAAIAPPPLPAPAAAPATTPPRPRRRGCGGGRGWPSRPCDGHGAGAQSAGAAAGAAGGCAATRHR